jgi:hypothetical protein
VSGWTKQRLGELLGGLQLFSDAAGSASITELEAVKGELRTAHAALTCKALMMCNKCLRALPSMCHQRCLLV